LSSLTSNTHIGLLSRATNPAIPSPNLRLGFLLYASEIDWVALTTNSLVSGSRSIKEEILEFITSAVT